MEAKQSKKGGMWSIGALFVLPSLFLIVGFFYVSIFEYYQLMNGSLALSLVVTAVIAKLYLRRLMLRGWVMCFSLFSIILFAQLFLLFSLRYAGCYYMMSPFFQ